MEKEETKKVNNIQKREITIKEYEDGTYELIGSAWNLNNLNSKEINEAFAHWIQNNLEVYSDSIKVPKIIKDNIN